MNVIKILKECREWLLRETRISEESRSAYAQELKKALDWISPEVETDRLQLIINCENCANYKKFRKKGTRKVTYLCSKDKTKREKTWFCADAKEK